MLSIDSIESPFSADWVVVKSDIPLVISTSTPLERYVSFPEKVKLAAPLPSFPFVTIYVTLIVEPFPGCLPKILSPNKIWYFSSSISWTRNNLDFWFTSNILL